MPNSSADTTTHLVLPHAPTWSNPTVIVHNPARVRTVMRIHAYEMKKMRRGVGSEQILLDSQLPELEVRAQNSVTYMPIRHISSSVPSPQRTVWVSSSVLKPHEIRTVSSGYT